MDGDLKNRDNFRDIEILKFIVSLFILSKNIFLQTNRYSTWVRYIQSWWRKRAKPYLEDTAHRMKMRFYQLERKEARAKIRKWEKDKQESMAKMGVGKGEKSFF